MAAVDERRDEKLEALYRRYAGDVHRYARAVTTGDADAEDVTQQTFVNAYRALVRGEQPRKPLHWLIAIAHNVHRERLRQSLRRPTEVELDESVRVAPREEAEWSADEIRQALDRLGSKQRAVIVLRELEGRSYAEIAHELGLSKPATEALAFRARRALREQLEGTLTCEDAQAAVHRRLNGGLSGPEQGALRAHLRACRACAGSARSERGRRRRRFGGLAVLPFPLHSLEVLFGGGGASAGSGAAAKVAVAAAAGIVATGVGYDGVRHATRHISPAPKAALAAAADPSHPRDNLSQRQARAAASAQTFATRPVPRLTRRQSSSTVPPRPRPAKDRKTPAAAHRAARSDPERSDHGPSPTAVGTPEHEDSQRNGRAPRPSTEGSDHGEGQPASSHDRGAGPPPDRPSARGRVHSASPAADPNARHGQGNGRNDEADDREAAPPNAQPDAEGDE